MNSGVLIISLFFLCMVWMLISLARSIMALNAWKSLYPETLDLETIQFQIAPELVQQKTPEALVEDALFGRLKQDLSGHFLLANTQLTVVKAKNQVSQAFGKLLLQLNTYLVKIGAVAPDYNLVKSLATAQEKALLKQSLPIRFPFIFIGFAGAMLLVALGFYSLSGDGGLNDLYFALTMAFGLLAVGALIGVWIQYFYFPNIQYQVEKGRDQFLYYVESELLPLANEDLTQVLEKMQQNFEYFNTNFRKNITDFEGLMGTINKNVSLETALLQELSKLNLEELANSNAQIFKKLDGIMTEFDKFVGIMDRMNQNAASSVDLSKNLGTLTKEAERINLSIGRIAQDVDNKLHVSTEMIRFLKRHFTELDDRKAIITRAVINFDDFIKKSFDQLERHAMERVIALKELKIREEGQLINALKSQKGGLGQLHNLEAILKEMKTMNEKISDLSAQG
ncbi:MAG: hypothetical protein AAFV80_15435 [Bacteroidota bacterium]